MTKHPENKPDQRIAKKDKQPLTPEQKQRRREQIKAELLDVGSRLLQAVTGNWGMKLLALAIAVALWAGLITQDPSLTREKDFDNVPVSVNGLDSLKRNGYVVLSDLDAVLENVSIDVDVPQGQYSRAAASNYNLRIDLSRIKESGKQEVRLLATNSITYGTVTRISPASVTLIVDEYVTRYRIPVTVDTVGQPPEGFWADVPSTDPPTVAVTGPKSIVDRIASVKVMADQANLPAQEGTDRRALAYQLLDQQGNRVDDSQLEVTTEGVLLDSVIVEQQVFPTRVVDMADAGLIKGKPAPGYEVKGVTITPGTITIAGRSTLIDELRVLYADTAVDVGDMDQSFTEKVRVRQTNIARFMSTDSVTVSVEIGPIMVDRSWTYVPIGVSGLKSGLHVEMSASSVTFRANGAQLWLDGMSRAALKVTCDMSHVSEPGTYEVPLICMIDHADGEVYTCEVEPAVVTLTVTAD